MLPTTMVFAALTVQVAIVVALTQVVEAPQSKSVIVGLVVHVVSAAAEHATFCKVSARGAFMELRKSFETPTREVREAAPVVA